MDNFMVFNLWNGPDFVFNFYFYNSLFPVPTHGLDFFSGAYSNKSLFPWHGLIENSSI